MSNSDSFIDEVTEEVRRDRLFGLMRRYGWIAALAILLMVGGAAWNEWRKHQERLVAQATGDAVIAALALDERDARAAALQKIDVPGPNAQAVVTLLAAAESAETDPAGTAEALFALAESPEIDSIYRQIATLKAVTLPGAEIDPARRVQALERLLAQGGVLRLLAEEQLALIELETGAHSEALGRLERIVADAEATQGLRRRASQLIVALGGSLPDLPSAVQDPATIIE